MAALNLLEGYIRVAGHFRHDRLHIIAQCIEAQILPEINRGGSTADEVQTVVQRMSVFRLMDAHADESGCDQCKADDKGNDSLLNKTVNFLMCDGTVKLLTADTDTVKRIADPSGDGQGGKHRENGTNSQCRRESLNRTCAHDIQHSSCDQCRDLAIKNRRERLVESEMQRLVQRSAGRQFLTDSHVNNTVRVDGHTDGQDQAGDAGKRQRDIKRIHESQTKEYEDQECPRRSHAGNPVHNDHEKHNQEQTDETCRNTGGKGFLSERGSDNIGINLVQFQRQ